MKIKNKKYLFYTLLFAGFFGINIVYAATGKGTLNFCQYVGTRRTFKILGYFILILKIMVPLILTGMCMSDIFKIIIGQNGEGFAKTVPVMIRRVIAAVVVFLIPTIIDAGFTLLIGTNNPEMQICSTCLFNTKKCYVPTNANTGDLCSSKDATTCTLVVTNN